MDRNIWILGAIPNAELLSISATVMLWPTQKKTVEIFFHETLNATIWRNRFAAIGAKRSRDKPQKSDA